MTYSDAGESWFWDNPPTCDGAQQGASMQCDTEASQFELVVWCDADSDRQFQSPTCNPFDVTFTITVSALHQTCTSCSENDTITVRVYA